MALKPTDEQQSILDAFPTGDNLVIEAGAGSGKTSTLKMLAAQNPNMRGLYLAYNRAIKDDAAKSFPSSVTCMTSHGLAYRPVGTRFKTRLNGARVPAIQAARILRINQPFQISADGPMLQPKSIARVVTETVARFCHSADREISRYHVPVINGFEERPARAELARFILPYAQRAWEDLTRTDGQLHFTHDTYLKLFQLGSPVLDYDYLLVDEAQDLNPVVKAIVDAQQAQVVLVGDRCQAIYGWRGAVDAMESADGKRLYLSQSFRFGQAVADEANKWLSILNADLRLRGFDKVPSTVAPLATPDAILCRSNAAALGRVMAATDKGVRVGLVGGGAEIKALARAAADLMDGKGTDHAELMAFRTWDEVKDYAEHDAAGSDLKVLVSMVDKYGPEKMIATMDRLTDERYASLVVSTAHKAKGREWDRVQICDDFREPKKSEDNPNPQIDRAEAMLAYVAVTRAKLVLDRDGLAWVDGWLSTSTATVDPAPVAQVVDEPVVETPELLPQPAVDAHGEDEQPVAQPPVVPAAQPAEPAFPVGSMVRYRPGKYVNLTRFTVVDARWTGEGEWLYDLRQPRDGRLQRGIRGGWLEGAGPAQPAPAAEGPTPTPEAVEPEAPAQTHCLRCGSRNCFCGPDELARFHAYRNATTPEEGRRAFETYQRAKGLHDHSAWSAR